MSCPQPVACTVSSPFNVSTKTDCLDILVCIDPAASLAKKGCTISPERTTNGTAIKGTNASGPAIKLIM